MATVESSLGAPQAHHNREEIEIDQRQAHNPFTGLRPPPGRTGRHRQGRGHSEGIVRQ